MEFSVFHRYIALAKEGRCKPLLCRHCYDELQLVLGPNDSPALKCYACNVLTMPGTKMYSDIRAVVEEWTE